MEDSNITNQRIEKSLLSAYSKKGYDNISVNFESGSNKGDGYVGLMIRAVISAEKDGRKEVLDTIVKCASSDPVMRKYVPTTQQFCKEIFYYTNVIPLYEKLQVELNIPMDMKCDLPKSYLANDKYMEEFIVLENLKSIGYTMGMTDNLDYKHYEIAFQMLGKLHALSLVLENRHKKVFDTLLSQLDEASFVNPDEFDSSGISNYFEKTLHKFINCTENENHKNMVEKAIGENLLVKMEFFQVNGKIKVISHGDFWMNNTLFKYEDGKPVKAIPVDFQISRYTSAVNDFVYFLGSSSDTIIRRNHFWQLFDVYYNSIREYVTACGYDLKDFFSYEEFKLELYDQAVLGLCVCIFTLPFFTTGEIFEARRIFSGNIPEKFYETSEVYRRRANDIVTDYVNWGLLK